MLHSYMVFRDEIRSWRNRILQAEIQGTVPDTQPHWWDGVPLTVPPPPLTFAVSAKGPMLDNYFTGTEFDLYSTRLIALLHDAGVQCETFPATLIDRKTKAVLPVAYAVFHLLEVHPALTVYRATSGPPIIERLELITEKWIIHQRPLFRAQEATDIVLIHTSLHQQLEAVGITGCTYTPVEEAAQKAPWS
jgi:hypothetical protein